MVINGKSSKILYKIKLLILTKITFVNFMVNTWLQQEKVVNIFCFLSDEKEKEFGGVKPTKIDKDARQQRAHTKPQWGRGGRQGGSQPTLF